MPDYNGLTRNQWPGTWSPSSSHPIVLDTEMRGGLRYVSGSVGDRLSNITGQRLQDGMIVYVENGYTENLTTYEGGKYYKYTVLPSESRNASTGELPNDSANWGLFSTSDISEGTNQYYTTAKADSDARSALVGFQAGGDGSFSYDSATGIFTYTGPSAEEVRAHFTANKGLSLTSGEFNIDSANVKGMFSGGTGITYNSTSGEIKTNDGQISHNSLSGYDADQHVDHTAVSVTAGAGLTGGGDISSTKTINVVGGKGIIANADDIQVDSANLVTLARESLSGSNSLDYNSSTGDIRAPQPLDSSANPTFNQLRGPSTFIIDPAAVGSNTGTVQILGNLQVDGNTTTINSINVSVKDKTFSLASDAADSSLLNGGGIIWGGASITANKPSFLYNHAEERFDANRTINATSFIGDVTGNVTGNVSGTAATVTDAAQTNITSLGTLTGLTVDGEIDARGGITDNGGGLVLQASSGSAIGLKNHSGDNIIRVTNGGVAELNHTSNTKLVTTAYGVTVTGTVNADSATFTNVTGTLQTAAQANITSVGNLASLTVIGEIDARGGITDNAGPLVLQAKSGEPVRLRNHSGNNIVSATNAGAAKLNYTDSLKLETTAYGVTVTGTMNADSATLTNLTVSGTIDGEATLATTAGTATNVTAVANNSTDESVFITFVDGATGSQGIETDTHLTYNPGTNTLSLGAGGDALTIDDAGEIKANGNTLTLNSTSATAIQHQNNTKLNTTKYGVTVTGTVNADSATITGNIRADNGELILGDEAYSISSDFVGLKTANQSGSQEYMIISGVTGGDGGTYISSKAGTSVNIRGPNNDTNHALRVTSSYALANGDFAFDSPNAVFFDNSSQKLSFGDVHRLTFGTDSDLKIYHDGSNSYIADEGTGNLNIKSNFANIFGAGGTSATFYPGNSVDLYYNNVKKFETTDSGFNSTDNITVRNGALEIGNHTFGGGTYHGLRTGFMTGGNDFMIISGEADGNTYLSAKSGAGVRIRAGGNDANHQLQVTSFGVIADGDFAFDSANAVFFDNSQQKLSFGDGRKATFGNDSDLEIYHTGGASLIEEGGTGGLVLRTNNLIQLDTQFGSEVMAKFIKDGAAELYYNGLRKVMTDSDGMRVMGIINQPSGIILEDPSNTAYGGHITFYDGTSTEHFGNGDVVIGSRNNNNRLKHIVLDRDDTKVRFTGDVQFDSASGILFDKSDKALEFGDNYKASFGAGGDLEIYHDTSNSYIVDGGTGNLILQTGQFQLKNASGNESLIVATGQAAVNLYYDNVNRLQTTPYGANVTGTVNADSATISGPLQVTGEIDARGGITDNGSNLVLQSSSGKAINLKNNAGDKVIRVTNAGSAELFHSDNRKLHTTAYGVTVTGTVNADSATFNDTIRINGDGNKGLIIGDEALSASNDYVGMKSTNMTDASEYMILTGVDGSQNNATFLSAGDGCSVFIRGGKNAASHQIEVSSSLAKAHGNFEITGTLNGHTIPSGAGTLALTSDISGGGGGLDSAAVLTVSGRMTGAELIPASDSNDNTAIGTGALANAGSNLEENTAVGKNTIQFNQIGDKNTAVGFEALRGGSASNTFYYDNTAIGHKALHVIENGSDNVAIGASASQNNTSGHSNVAVGNFALSSNTSGQYNTVMGLQALSTATTPGGNVAIGYRAGAFLNTPFISGLTIVGNSAAQYTQASNTTAIGQSALQDNTTGDGNTAVGYFAARDITTGGGNTVMGMQSMFNSGVDISNNTAIGYYTLYNATRGENTAIGYKTLEANLGGTANTALGSEAGNDITTGNGNTVLGYKAGDALTTGSNNVIIGRYSGNSGGLDIRTSSNNIILSDGDSTGPNVRLHINSSGVANFKGDVVVDSDLSVAGDFHFDSANAIMFDKSAKSLKFGDNYEAVFGAGTDLRIYHDPATNNSIIKESGTGSLFIDATDLQLRARDGEPKAKFIADAAVELYHSNLKKFETTTYGATITGTVNADSATLTNLTLSAGTSVNEFSTDTTLGGNSDNAVPTEKAVKTYVDAEVAGAGGGGSGTISDSADVLTVQGTGSLTGVSGAFTVNNNLTVSGTKATVDKLELSSGFTTLDDYQFTTASTSVNSLTIGFTSGFGSYKIMVQAKRGSERHITEILCTHDGTTAVATEYGTVTTDTILATYDVDISGTDVRLRTTPTASTSTAYRVFVTSIGN